MSHPIAVDNRIVTLKDVNQHMAGRTPAPAQMTVCSILTSLTSGGAEILVANLNGEFVSRGARSFVVALCDAAELGNSPQMEARLRQQIERGGGTFHSLGLSRERGFLRGGWRLRRLLQEIAPSVVHAHTARAILMLAIAGTGGGPVLMTHHNSKLTFHPRMFALFDRVVDGYVAISDETDRIFRTHSTRPSTLIPNAASPAFRAEAPRTQSGSPGRILSVGAISHQKNYRLLIAAAAELRNIRGIRRMPMFQVAGGGADLDALRGEVQGLGLAQCVEFLGERSDVNRLMANSDVYLNTSLYEGMPVSFLEAMGSALPIVATEVGGNRELVETGRNGVLCPPGDPVSIARALERLLVEKEWFERLSAGSMEAGKAYSLSGTAKRHLDLYASLLACRPAGNCPPQIPHKS